MKAAELISRLATLDVRLSVAGARLRIDAPKGVLSADLREHLARLKKDVLAELRRSALRRNSNDRIPRVTADRPAPLSFVQQRIWFLQQLEPKSAVFNLCRAWRINGALDVDALARSLCGIERRHEALRTRLTMNGGRPSQIVQPSTRSALLPVDLRGLPQEQRRTEAARLMRMDARQPFDLMQERLFRTRLLRLDDERHILVLVAHHIVCDAWSMGILSRELWQFYENYRDEKSFSPAKISCRYRDFAVWQQDHKAAAFKEDLSYWRKKLADAPMLDLPIDRPRPTRASFHGGRVTLEIGESVTAGLNALGRREGATLFMILLAAFQALLCRWTGQEDIAVGAPFADRERSELENIVGVFLRTLVLRSDLSGEPDFRQLLKRVREVCLAAYARQSVPFEVLVRELSPPRGDRHPFFQAMLIVQNTPSEVAPPAGLELEPIEIDNESAQFELSLYLRERDGRLIGYFEYESEFFERATIERLADHFQSLLAGVVADPDRAIASLPLVSEVERGQIAVQRNATAAYPKTSTIHALFEAQAARSPDANALECDARKITYRELNARANRMAHELERRGVGPERFVGVLAERSIETIMGILAILKTGGAYVPLDPHYPKQRLAFMLADAGATVLLAQKKYRDFLPGYSGATLWLDEAFSAAAGLEANLPSTADTDCAAYVLYTSGSTGTPKGVVGLHRGALNRFHWMWETHPFADDEKACQKTSLGFVDSVWEIFGALLRGVPTVLVPDRIARDPELLGRHIGKSGVTRLVVVPSVLREMLARDVDLTSLRYCLSSGETLSKDLADKFRQAAPRCRLINLYGATEVAGDVACYEVGHGASSTGIAIGRPIANSQIYLLDRCLRPVPLGARGELYAGGANLARGYLNRPDLTAEKFVPNPFDRTGNSRLYRSGDLARWRADGNLELLGRSDDQVKIRGCRVEPGEVEAALRAHPSIRECAVVVGAFPRDDAEDRESRIDDREPQATELTPRSDNPKSKIQNLKSSISVVAHIVAQNERPAVAHLRAFLHQRLPDYMLPARFAFHQRLPRLANGKVDRNTLRQSAVTAEAAYHAVAAPHSEIEIVIAGVWRSVLKLDNVAVHDNFFEIGGHSLAAAEAAARLRDAFGQTVSVVDVFDAPTVSLLAGKIEKMLQGGVQSGVPPIRPMARVRGQALSFAQERIFLLSQLLGGDFLNLPYAYRLEGQLDVAPSRDAVREIVRRHDTLRTGFRDLGRGPRSFVRRSARISVPAVNLAVLPARLRETEMQRISRQDAGCCFDLEKPPLLRLKLLRLDDTRHVLLVTVHHIIGDQWSMGLFRNELAALYGAFSKGLRSPLPELSVQFGDFVRWQRDGIEQGYFQRQISYWAKQQSEPCVPLDFRGSSRREKTARFQSSSRPLTVNKPLLDSIRRLARERGCTPFMVCLAALAILLQRCTGKNQIRIGTLVANRGRPGTDALFGYCINAVVLRLDLDEGITYGEIIDRARETVLAAQANQDVPFEHLEALLESRYGKDAPLYQVMLNYRYQTEAELQTNGLTIASWNGKQRAADPGIAVSRLDVNFHLRELPTRLAGVITYRTDLFDNAAIEKFLRDYTAILQRMVRYKNARMGAPAR
ncbi:MAG TPA: amino acid adenylation domain-containing protein [Candidatus Binatia bacterium]|nr:amino acid adenylation domain-containing protein [Candidatus Binatia bacterium]